MNQSQFNAGDRLGPLTVERTLGRGGMGVTYLLRDDKGQPIVMKVLLPDKFIAASDNKAIYNEITALLRVEPNPNVARIRYAALEGYSPRIFMDYAAHGDLWTFARRLAVSECWWVLLNVINGMGFLTEQHGVIHCDLKPHNLLIDGDGLIWVSDFGLAKLASTDVILRNVSHHELVSITQSKIVGTPSFMAPEQICGNGLLDMRSDIWAIGVTIYWLATSKLPFEGRTIEELRARILTERPLAPKTINVDVDDHLNAVIMKCLAKDPAGRYQSYREFGQDVLVRALFESEPCPLLKSRKPPFEGPKVVAYLRDIFEIAKGWASGNDPAHSSKPVANPADIAPDGSDWLSYVQRVQNFLNVVNLAEARRLIEAGLEHDPNHPILLTQQAALLARLGRNDEATKAFDRLLDYEDPRGSRRIPALAYSEAISFYTLTDDYERAHAVEQQARLRLQTEPDAEYRAHYEETIKRALAFLQRSEATYNEMRRLSVDLPTARSLQAARACQRAIVYVGQGLHEPAAHLFRLAVAADPSYGPGWADLGSCLFDLQQYEQSYEALRKASLLIPKDGVTWLQLGRVSMKLGRLADALQFLRTALELGCSDAIELIEQCKGAAAKLRPS